MLVHGSDGRDITLCVTSLAQIILNPDCRTVRGFEALIEREWLQVGSTNSYRFERIVNIILKCMKMLNIFRTILLFHRLVIRFTQEWQKDLLVISYHLNPNLVLQHLPFSLIVSGR